MATETLTERRAREKTEAAANGSSNGKADDDAAARSLADLGAEAEQQGEEDDGQLFVMEGGTKIGLSSLVKRGTPVHYEFKMDGKGLKGAQGMSLISFEDPERVLVVPGRGGKIVIDPSYDGDGNVKHVTVRQHFKATTLYDSRTEAATVALRGE